MKTVIDAKTGAVRVVEFTPAEQARRAAEAAEWESRKRNKEAKANVRALREDAIEAVLESYRGNVQAPKAVKDYLAAKE